MATRKKRRHPRARAKGLSVLLSGPGGVTPCSVEDISLGGVFVRTAEPLLPGTELAITLVRPGMRKGLKVQSKVANQRTPGPGRQAGVGVRFEGLSDDTRSKLVSLLGEFGVANPVESEEEASEPPELPPPPRRAPRFEPTDSAAPLGKPFLQSQEDEEVSGGQLSLSRNSAVLGQPTRSLDADRLSDVSQVPDVMVRLHRQISDLLDQLGEAKRKVVVQQEEISGLQDRVAQLERALGQRDLLIASLRDPRRR